MTEVYEIERGGIDSDCWSEAVRVHFSEEGILHISQGEDDDDLVTIPPHEVMPFAKWIMERAAE